jgi:hypothetical protein
MPVRLAGEGPHDHDDDQRQEEGYRHEPRHPRRFEKKMNIGSAPTGTAHVPGQSTRGATGDPLAGQVLAAAERQRGSDVFQGLAFRVDPPDKLRDTGHDHDGGGDAIAGEDPSRMLALLWCAVFFVASAAASSAYVVEERL